MKRPPVDPRPNELPFHDPAFTWQTFEDFFCDFLAARPKIPLSDGTSRQVASARPYGRRGDRQDGIDIRAEMEGGEVWAFQCKDRKKRWGPKQTRSAIAKCTYAAARKFLLISRSVSERCRQVVAQHPDWELWDSGDISRHFLDPKVLPELEAARLLYVHFGPGWPEAMLGRSGLGPLIGADAKFAPWIRNNRVVHHRLPLVGRKNLLDRLDSFAMDKQHRVLLLVGRGGIGKSRLLYEWSRRFSRTHPGTTLRFLSDVPAEFGPALDAEAKPLVLVFDDAHRFDEVRRSLFPESARRSSIKMVLALRPGPTAQIRLELIDAGFDVSEIDEPEPVGRLTSKEALELAEKALGPRLAHHHRLRLRDLSRDCPLLAVLGADLLKRGELSVSALDDAREFQTHVFDAVLRDAGPVEASFGAVPTRDFLRLLAILSPVRRDRDFLTRTSRFLGQDLAPNHISDLLDALDKTGLLLTTGAGVRIVPDLLSDHLAYTACYTRAGQTTTFPERVLAHFPADQFSTMLQHLSEAEWRALEANDAADSVVEPLWRWFVSRFENNGFFARTRQLQEWANVAHFQPKRTLQLADLALRLGTAPDPENPRVRDTELNSHQHVIDCLPSLLKPVAQTHPEHVGACLDILWQLGRDQPPGIFREENHPLVVIRKIASFETWKSSEVPAAVLDWLERLFRGDDWLARKNRPGWLVPTLLEPFFATSVEESWSTGRRIHWRSLPISLENTARFRTRALALCRTLAARRSLPVTLGVVSVLEHAIDRARLGGVDEPPKRFRDAWLIERRKALAVMADLVRDHPEPLVHFRIRKALQEELRYGDSAEFQADCRITYESIPDSLDLRAFRAVLGGFHDDFDRPIKRQSDEGWERAKRRWDNFILETASALVARWPEARSLLAALAEVHAQIDAGGLTGSFAGLIGAMSRAEPRAAIDCAESLLESPEHPLADHLDAFVLNATKYDLPKRFDLCERAMSGAHDSLKAGAVACLAWWRREGELPPRAWEKLSEIAGTASPRVARSIKFFVTANRMKAVLADWELLAAIPAHPSDPVLASRIIAAASDILSVGPDGRVVTQVLKRLDPLGEIDAANNQFALSRIAEKFPAQVFLMYWRRVQEAQKAGNEKMEPIPHGFRRSAIDLPNVLQDPDVAEIIRRLESRLLHGPELDFWETRLLQMVVFRGGTDPDEFLVRVAQNVESSDHVERIERFVSLSDRAIDLECPDFTRELLRKARALGDDVHRSVFSTLKRLPGGRSSTNGEPDAEWKGLLETVERMAHEHANDPELGPLYAAAASAEREGMEHARMAARADFAALDEEG